MEHKVFNYGLSPLSRFSVLKRGDKTFYLLGEDHKYKYDKNSCDPSIFISPMDVINSMIYFMSNEEYGRKIFNQEEYNDVYGDQSLKKKLDIYFEYGYKIVESGNQTDKMPYESPMVTLMRYYENCLRKNSKCNIPNVRFHYSDMRPHLSVLMGKYDSKRDINNLVMALLYGSSGRLQLTVNESKIIGKIKDEIDKSYMKDKIHKFFIKKMEDYDYNVYLNYKNYVFALLTDMYTIARFYHPNIVQTHIVSYNGYVHTSHLYDFLKENDATILIDSSNVDQCVVVNFYDAPNLLRSALKRAFLNSRNLVARSKSLSAAAAAAI